MDNAATTKIKDKVLDAMLPYLKENYGNASSIYSLGQKSKAAIENSREIIAKALKVQSKEIYFTSGGSESDNWALKGSLKNNKINHIITSKIEHEAIINSCKFIESWGNKVDYISVDGEGFVNLEELQEKITEDTNLVSIMYANNEVGTIEPIDEIIKICNDKGVPIHVDAVQALGSLEIDLSDKNIDMMSFSGHKIGAPKGVGILYVRDGFEISSFIHGGEQERRKRASTENVASIVGLGLAVKDAVNNLEERKKYTEKLRDYFIEKLLSLPGVKLNGSRQNRLCGNINISFSNLQKQVLLPFLDMHGICASQGSACTAGSLKPSHVLLAMGKSQEEANNPLRLTINYNNTKDEVDYVFEIIKEAVNKFKVVV